LIESPNPGEQAYQFGLSAHSCFGQNRFELRPYGFTRQPVCNGYFIDAFALNQSLRGSSFRRAEVKKSVKNLGRWRSWRCQRRNDKQESGARENITRLPPDWHKMNNAGIVIFIPWYQNRIITHL
jgi:hypothetical protein